MFQQGGQMNEEQKAFTAYLIKVLNPKDAAVRERIKRVL